MNNRKLYGLAVCLLVGCLIFTGCGKPSGNPEDIVKSYCQNCLDGNYLGAYDVLADALKKQITKEEFMEWKQVGLTAYQTKEYKVNKVKEINDFKLGEVVYPYVVEYDISETDIVFSNDKKEVPTTYKGYVVSDNGQWKYFRVGDMRKSMSQAFSSCGYMALYGKGMKKDINQAVISLKKASQIDENAFDPYYLLGIAYKELGRLDDAETAANKGMEKSSNDKGVKSNFETLLGTIYSSKQMYEEARSHFQQALELNPDNEYARNNLHLLK